MPRKTLRPCSYPGCPNLVEGGRCELHKENKGNSRFSSIKRDPAVQRLYNLAWERRRASWLAAHPWCEECFDRGLYVGATEVHHVIPHKGDQEIFILSPLQSLCHACHLKKTLGEMRGDTPYYPVILRDLTVPLHMVCGPPGSGKNTYINERAVLDDLIIDLDQIIADLTGKPLYYPREDGALTRGWQVRNDILKSLEQPQEKIHEAWFIVSAGMTSDRRIWKELLRPESVTVLKTSEEECIKRIRKDYRRARIADQHIEAVKRWHQYFVAQDDEDVIEN